jgi:hypothetical protein
MTGMTLLVVYQTRVISGIQMEEWGKRVDKMDKIAAERKKDKKTRKYRRTEGKVMVRRERNRRRRNE